MIVNGCNSLSPAPAKAASFPAVRGPSFMDQLKKATNAAEKAADSLNLSMDDASLKALYDRLTPESKQVLERIRAGKSDIGKEEWNSLCKELQGMGALTESDYMYTRSDLHLIPIGYQDQNGNYVEYELPSELKNKLLSQANGKTGASEDGLWACLDDSGWKGDPLNYLDNWTASLYSWRSDLARMRNDDGSPRYNDFSPLTNQINSCQKVAGLVRELGKF